FVWPGAMFNTNGTKQGGIFADVDFTNGIVNAPQFEPDVNNQPTAADIFGGTDAVPQGDVNLFVEDFKFPQVFRTSLGVAKTFGDGWNVSLDGIYTKTLNNIVYQSVNFENNFTSTPGPESRIQYVSNAAVDSRYRSIYVGYNTNEGHSFNFSTGVDKQFENFFGSLFYSYGDSYALNEGTSSQNSSQWRGQVHDVGGRNNPVFGRSDFSAGHRVVGTTAYKFDWNDEKNVATTVSLFYNGQSGTPFSWIVGGDDADNFSNENGSTSRNRTLFYIPQSRGDINLMDTDDLTADQQWALLNNFIENDDYLSDHRGEYAEKNSNRLPFESQLDVKVLQDFGLTLGDKRHRFQFSADIFNFGNLISKDWGTTWSTNDSFSYQTILNLQGFDTDGSPIYTFTDDSLDDERFNINDISSRWRAQIGFRYLFD
nr:hypothetical protein [Saprospiraceae bacterium]